LWQVGCGQLRQLRRLRQLERKQFSLCLMPCDQLLAEICHFYRRCRGGRRLWRGDLWRAGNHPAQPWRHLRQRHHHRLLLYMIERDHLLRIRVCDDGFIAIINRRLTVRATRHLPVLRGGALTSRIRGVLEFSAQRRRWRWRLRQTSHLRFLYSHKSALLAYSSRSAVSGSIRAARQAGTAAARRTTGVTAQRTAI